MMISPKKLIKMARKWQSVAALGRKRTNSLPGTRGVHDAATTTAVNNHFVVYTLDRKRYVFPITYLNTYIFRELLILSEEEFGLPGNGPITFPCDSVFMDYAANLMRRQATEEIERVLLMSIANYRCLLSCPPRHQEFRHEQLLPCVF